MIDFDTGPIYALGNKWIVLGDVLYEQLQTMDRAVGGMDWTGSAGLAAHGLWRSDGNDVYSAVHAAMISAYRVGESINNFATNLQDKINELNQQELLMIFMAVFEVIGAILSFGVGFGLSLALDAILTVAARFIQVIATALNTFAGRALAFGLEAGLQGAGALGTDVAIDAMAHAAANVPYEGPDWQSEAINIVLSAGGAAVGYHFGKVYYHKSPIGTTSTVPETANVPVPDVGNIGNDPSTVPSTSIPTPHLGAPTPVPAPPASGIPHTNVDPVTAAGTPTPVGATPHNAPAPSTPSGGHPTPQPMTGHPGDTPVHQPGPERSPGPIPDPATAHPSPTPQHGDPDAAPAPHVDPEPGTPHGTPSSQPPPDQPAPPGPMLPRPHGAGTAPEGGDDVVTPPSTRPGSHHPTIGDGDVVTPPPQRPGPQHPTSGDDVVTPPPARPGPQHPTSGDDVVTPPPARPGSHHPTTGDGDVVSPPPTQPRPDPGPASPAAGKDHGASPPSGRPGPEQADGPGATGGPRHVEPEHGAEHSPGEVTPPSPRRPEPPRTDEHAGHETGDEGATGHRGNGPAEEEHAGHGLLQEGSGSHNRPPGEEGPEGRPGNGHRPHGENRPDGPHRHVGNRPEGGERPGGRPAPGPRDGNGAHAPAKAPAPDRPANGTFEDRPDPEPHSADNKKVEVRPIGKAFRHPGSTTHGTPEPDVDFVGVVPMKTGDTPKETFDALQELVGHYEAGASAKSGKEPATVSLVVGLNRGNADVKNIDAHINEHLAGLKGLKSSIPVTVLGAGWKSSTPGYRGRPYGGIRQQIVEQPEVADHVHGPGRGTKNTYLHFGDADVRSMLTTEGEGLFVAAARKLGGHETGEGPKLLSGGYRLHDEHGHQTLESKKDAAVREVFGKAGSKLNYFPEPNTFYRTDHGSVLDGGHDFGTYNKEGQHLFDSIGKDYVRGEKWARWDGELSVGTDKSRVNQNGRADPQSHAEPGIWAERVQHLLDKNLGNNVVSPQHVKELGSIATDPGRSGMDDALNAVRRDLQKANLPKGESARVVKMLEGLANDSRAAISGAMRPGHQSEGASSGSVPSSAPAPKRPDVPATGGAPGHTPGGEGTAGSGRGQGQHEGSAQEHHGAPDDRGQPSGSRPRPPTSGHGSSSAPPAPHLAASPPPPSHHTSPAQHATSPTPHPTSPAPHHTSPAPHPPSPSPGPTPSHESTPHEPTPHEPTPSQRPPSPPPLPPRGPSSSPGDGSSGHHVGGPRWHAGPSTPAEKGTGLVPEAAFGHRRDGAPVSHVHTESFQPSRGAHGGLDHDGYLVHSDVVTARHEVRRIQAEDGSWVHDVTVPAHLEGNPRTVENVIERVQNALATLNHRYRLPNGDQFHIRFDPRAGGGDDVPTVTVHTGHGRSDQENWYADEPDSVLVHEILHALGLLDGYRTDSAVGGTLDPVGVMGGSAAHGRPVALTWADLRRILDVVGATTPVRDHPLVPRR